MFISLWSVKGGSGTTVVAGALALLLARSAPGGVLLVDLGGDVPAALGLGEPSGPGVAEWLAAGASVPADGWSRLEVEAAPGLHLVPRGEGPLEPLERVEVLCGMLALEPRAVIVDCGGLGAHGPADTVEAARCFASSGTHSLLVTRGSYLGLRRAQQLPVHPSGLVYVRDPGCALDAADLSSIVGAPVWAEVADDPAVLRAVDSGLLRYRLPRSLERALRHAA